MEIIQKPTCADEHGASSSLGSPSKEYSQNIDSTHDNCELIHDTNPAHENQTVESKAKALAKYQEFRSKIGNFFTFNWFKEEIKKSKYFPDASFTPVVFWVYISSQYFPFHTHTLNPEETLRQIRSPVSPINSSDELTSEPDHMQKSFQEVASNIIVNSSEMKDCHGSKAEKEKFVEKLKNVTADSLISRYSEYLNSRIEHNNEFANKLTDNWKNYYDISKADDIPEVIHPKDIPLKLIDAKTTKAHLLNLQNNFDEMIMKYDPIYLDFIYPSKLEDDFLSFIEKKSQKLSQNEQSKKGRSRIKYTHTRHNIGTRSSTKSDDEQKKDEAHNNFGALVPQSALNNFQHLVGNYKNKFVHEDDIVCQICNDGDYEDTNVIIICSVNF
jgi:hypothetical protein